MRDQASATRRRKEGRHLRSFKRMDWNWCLLSSTIIYHHLLSSAIHVFKNPNPNQHFLRNTQPPHASCFQSLLKCGHCGLWPGMFHGALRMGNKTNKIQILQLLITFNNYIYYKIYQQNWISWENLRYYYCQTITNMDMYGYLGYSWILPVAGHEPFETMWPVPRG